MVIELSARKVSMPRARDDDDDDPNALDADIASWLDDVSDDGDDVDGSRSDHDDSRGDSERDGADDRDADRDGNDANDEDEDNVVDDDASSERDEMQGDDEAGDDCDAYEAGDDDGDTDDVEDGVTHSHEDDTVIPWLQSDSAIDDNDDEVGSGDENDDDDSEATAQELQSASAADELTQPAIADADAPSDADDDVDDDENDANESVAAFSDNWAGEYITMDVNTVASTAHNPLELVDDATAALSEHHESLERMGSLSKLFNRLEPSSSASRTSSLRDEINLVEQAVAARAASAVEDANRSTALTPSSSQLLPTGRSLHARSFSSASTLVNSIAASEAAAAAEPSLLSSTEVRVHPIATSTTPTATTTTDHVSEQLKRVAPLSPNSLKRAASVYLSPTTTSRALMLKRQDSLSTPTNTNVSQLQQLWHSDTTTASRRGSSRLLDEWKRKEIWHDFKRAEGHGVAAAPSQQQQQQQQPPQAAVPATTHTIAAMSESSASSSTSRIESLLENLRAEISSSNRTADKPLVTAAATGGETTVAPSASEPRTNASAPLRSSDLPTHASRRQSTSASSDSQLPRSSTAGENVAASCTRTEYEQLLQDKRTLADELENRKRASSADKERIWTLNVRVEALEAAERENRRLEDELERRVRQERSASERAKSLGEQLTDMAKSEEQLQIQTQQLFQQNQALQSELLEKIAAEASKIEKMAHLTAENETLGHELARSQSVVMTRQQQHSASLQQTTIRRLLRVKRLAHLRAAMTKLQTHAERHRAARLRALHVFAATYRVAATRTLASAFRRLQLHGAHAQHRAGRSGLQLALEDANDATRTLAARSSALQLAHCFENWRLRRLRDALRALDSERQQRRTHAAAVARGYTVLHTLLLSRVRSRQQHAFLHWRTSAELETARRRCEQAQRSERELLEAKDCVFALSREKTKLEDKLVRAFSDAERQTEDLSESRAELQVVKHGYVATVVREFERGWLRLLFTEWRLQTYAVVASKDLQQQTEEAERRATERDEHTKSVEDYNRVLRSDLERFQFFSQDKRIAVDVLTKKLLREEEKFKHMEETHVVLEERAHVLRSKLTTLVAYDGLELPLPLVALAKDSAVRSLHDLFMLHATIATPTTSSALNDMTTVRAPRLAIDALLRLLECSRLLEHHARRQEALAACVVRHFPADASARGVLFPDFVVGVSSALQSVSREHERSESVGSESDSENSTELAKTLWCSLLALVDPNRWAAGASGNSAANGNSSGASRDQQQLAGVRSSPWTGRLSDDILQNQEKLLAVLEHETAVVERAVMEKASLKHTYSASDHHAPSASTFYEYQCDPMLPPEPPTHGVSASASASNLSTAGTLTVTSGVTTDAAATDAYANWYQTPQIRDLFLAFHAPLLKVLRKYSHDTRFANHSHQLCLQLPDVLHMLRDLKLFPTYLTEDVVRTTFSRLCAPDGVLTPQAFTLFLGACALELYTKSLASAMATTTSAFALSPREILVAFFCDLGFLAESDAPVAARICFVGAEIESILWSLFEYYASSTDDDGASATVRADDERIAMTSSKFAKFMTEIAGAIPTDNSSNSIHSSNSNNDNVFARVRSESRRFVAAQSQPETPAQWTMYFDDFYSAIAYAQQLRQADVTYAAPGDAVRHWMQQTQ